MLLRQIWTSCPFWGILAVGQGAAVASILLTLLLTSSSSSSSSENDNAFGNKGSALLAPPQFAVFVSGQSLVQVDDDDGEDFGDTPFPVLHLVDKNITIAQESLIRQFGGTVEHRNTNSETSSFESRDLNVIGRFVCQQKKHLFSPSSSAHDSNNESAAAVATSSFQQQEIVSLQTALHLAEQQAAHAIAETHCG